MFLHVIQNGFEFLIDKNVVDIDMTSFRDLIANKVESLEPIRNLDYSKIKNQHLKKSHLICKEFLLELQLDDPKVRVPYV